MRIALSFLLVLSYSYGQFVPTASPLQVGELKEIVKAFCNQEKQFQSEYDAQVSIHDKFFFAKAGMEFPATIKLAYQCPQFFRMDMQSAVGEMTFIMNGVEAWIATQAIGMKGRNVDYYHTLQNKNLGYWLDFMRALQDVPTLSGKKLSDFDVELTKLSNFEKTKELTVRVKIPRYKSTIEMTLDPLHANLMSQFNWEDSFGKFQMKYIPSTLSHKNIDRAHFHFFPAEGDSVNTILD